MRASRATVIRAIRIFSDELGRQYADEAPIEHLEEPVVLCAALVLACEICGISVEEYAAALYADPSLLELERESTLYAVVGTPDPGPYDEISRESPSGQPGVLTKPRSAPRRVSLGR